MRPPDSIIVGCVRWLDLLQRNSLSGARAILRASARNADLTLTQYEMALRWLYDTGLLVRDGDASIVAAYARNLVGADAAEAVFTATLVAVQPLWLQATSDLAADDLPVDGRGLSERLGLTDARAFSAVQHAKRKVDANLRAEIGSAGEEALLAILERNWPHSTTHVSASDDTAGYDIAFRHLSKIWHLEVKATTRRGRLAVFVSRNEYEVSRIDPSWRLVVVGLGDDRRLEALATVRENLLHETAPWDRCDETRWASAEYKIGAGDLEPGLRCQEEVALDNPVEDLRGLFSWMPTT